MNFLQTELKCEMKRRERLEKQLNELDREYKQGKIQDGTYNNLVDRFESRMDKNNKDIKELISLIQSQSNQGNLFHCT